MPELEIQARKIVRKEGTCGGVPILEGTRVRVSDVVVHYDFKGKSPEKVAEEFSLSVADVFSALTYYFEHPGEIREEIRVREDFFKQIMNGSHHNGRASV
mgnify:CR=1 FL=1